MNIKYNNYQTYINENHNARPKELFIRLADFIEDKRKLFPKNARVLDIGCATGALIEYLKYRFPDYSFTGIDISEELIRLARNRVSDCNFYVSSATELEVIEDKFDIILCFGVLGIFEEEIARKIILDIISMIENRGLCYFVAQFNNYDVDVSIKHKKYVSGEETDWECGWSIFSQRTIRKWLEGCVRAIRFIEFEPCFELQPANDPVRTWTIEVAGKKQLTNGLKLLVDLVYLEITV